jgi:diaminopimelate epimerase
MRIPFVKMHGLGNDFIVIDELEAVGAEAGAQSLASSSLGIAQVSIQLCDRRFGIGADQILLLKPVQQTLADYRMEILNSDGSVAEMCGNGIRAVALYFHRKLGSQGRGSYRVETLAGVKTVAVDGEQVAVDMGAPVLGGGFIPGRSESESHPGEPLEVLGRTLRFYEVSMGNPHAVIFVEDWGRFPVEQFGPCIEKHVRFPKRTNVEFVKVAGESKIQVKVWERGAGLTLACGTGACASAVASLATGRVRGEVQVELPGGALSIGWKGEGHSVIMKGPAVEVFRGEVEL